MPSRKLRSIRSQLPSGLTLESCFCLFIFLSNQKFEGEITIKNDIKLLANVLIQIIQIWVIFIHVKLWVAVARQLQEGEDFNYLI